MMVNQQKSCTVRTKYSILDSMGKMSQLIAKGVCLSCEVEWVAWCGDGLGFVNMEIWQRSSDWSQYSYYYQHRMASRVENRTQVCRGLVAS